MRRNSTKPTRGADDRSAKSTRHVWQHPQTFFV